MKSVGRMARSVAMITQRPVMGSLRNSGNSVNPPMATISWVSLSDTPPVRRRKASLICVTEGGSVKTTFTMSKRTCLPLDARPARVFPGGADQSVPLLLVDSPVRRPELLAAPGLHFNEHQRVAIPCDQVDFSRSRARPEVPCDHLETSLLEKPVGQILTSRGPRRGSASRTRRLARWREASDNRSRNRNIW